MYLFTKLVYAHNGGVGYKVQILNIKKYISSIAQHFFLMPDNIPCFLVQIYNLSLANGYHKLKTSKDNTFLLLQFLKNNIGLYSNLVIVIAEERLNQILVE